MKKKWTIPLNLVPPELSVQQYILEVTDLQKHIDYFSAMPIKEHVEARLNFNLDELKKDMRFLLEKYPASVYQYSSLPYGVHYKMIYLTHNPESLNPQIATPMPGPAMEKMSFDQLGIHYGKNSYQDTLGIKERSHISKELSLKTFLDGLTRTLVRSRIALHSGQSAADEKAMLNWHVDESVFFNLRLNIPVVSSKNFAIEYVCEDNQKISQIKSFDLREQCVYTFDTGAPHCFYSKKATSEQRISLICGISPWFDFDKEQQAWISNEYYGQLHPVDILKEGDLGPYILPPL